MEHRLTLSTADEFGAVLRAVWALAGRVDVAIAATTGIASGAAAAKAIACGATVVQATSAILREGLPAIARIENELCDALLTAGKTSVHDLHGLFCLPAATDPGEADRVGYIAAILGRARLMS